MLAPIVRNIVITSSSHTRRVIVLVFVACIATCVFVSASADRELKAEDGSIGTSTLAAQAHYVMGTMLEVQIANDGASNDRLFSCVFHIARRYDDIFSTFKSDSPVSEFNRLGRDHVTFEVPQEMAELASLAERVADQTHGAFSITVGPLVKLWIQAAKEQRWPTKDELESARRLTGSHRITIDQTTPTITPLLAGVNLDFNGIAKGFCVDEIVTHLREAEVHRAFVNFGESSIYALGSSPTDTAWSVDIRDPQNPKRIALRLRIRDAALGSSSSYEHPQRIKSVTVNHVIDPRTGLPADAKKAVTVIAPTATIADALSTALLVLPIAEGLQVLRDFHGAEAVIFHRSESGRWRKSLSSGMKKYLRRD